MFKHFNIEKSGNILHFGQATVQMSDWIGDHYHINVLNLKAMRNHHYLKTMLIGAQFTFKKKRSVLVSYYFTI